MKIYIIGIISFIGVVVSLFIIEKYLKNINQKVDPDIRNVTLNTKVLFHKEDETIAGRVILTHPEAKEIIVIQLNKKNVGAQRIAYMDILEIIK